MSKSTQIALFICLCFTSTVFAQYTLDDFTIPVGGYITDDAGLPIENAPITFIDQATYDEYTGTTDISGWYGNLGYSSVPDIPSSQVLGNAYPNPFGNSTSIEIQSGNNEKSVSSSGEIDIFDVRGRKVGSVPASSGTHEVKTTSGVLANGAYFYRYAGETKKMIGSPKFISIKTISSSGNEKSLVEYGVLVNAVGYEDFSGLVSLDDSQANYMDFNLQSEAGQFQALSIKVFNISGSECLLGGSVTVSGVGYSQTEFAGADSLFIFAIPVSVDSVWFSTSGFVGYDHASQIFAVLHPDSVAVRGALASDVAGALVSDLPAVVFLELVPEERLDSPFFWESVFGPNNEGLNHNLEDKRFVLRLNTDESGYTEPANEVTLNKLRVERDAYFEILDGGSVDGVALIGYTSEETTDLPMVQGMMGRHDLYVKNDTSTPGSNGIDSNSDGVLDYAFSYIRDVDSQDIAREEIANPTVLYDNPNKVVQNLIDDIYYRDIVHTVMKSRIGRNLYFVPPQDRYLSVRVFNISGSECLLDGSVTLSRGAYSQTETVGTDSLFSFFIPASVDSVEFSISSFVGYDNNPVFNILRTDRNAANAWVADDEFGCPPDSLTSTVYLEIVPDERMSDIRFVRSIGTNTTGCVARWREAPDIYLRTKTSDSEWTEDANPLAIQQIDDGWQRIFVVLAGGSADNLALMDYTYTVTDEAPDWSGYVSMFGTWDSFVDNTAPYPGNGGPSDWDGDGDNDRGGSFIRDHDSDGATMDELLGPLSLYDNPHEVSGAYLGNGTITPWGIDAIHTIYKSRLGRWF